MEGNNGEILGIYLEGILSHTSYLSFFDTSYSKLDTRWCAGDNHEVCIIKWENVGPIFGGEITGKYWADFREEGKFLDI